MKDLNPLIILEAMQAEETFKAAKRRLAEHVLDAYGWAMNDEVGIKNEPGIWVVQRAVVGFATRKKNQAGPELTAKICVKRKGSESAIESYFDFSQVL